jgi:hypothetical protein
LADKSRSVTIREEEEDQRQGREWGKDVIGEGL